MKIKEVTAQTGLTDRAVRFYIESGLVFPDSEENYAGRRKFDFSEQDVRRLSDIALLRSAGFSVEQIKNLYAGNNIQNILQDRLNTLSEDAARGEKTTRTLSPLCGRQDLDVSMILNALKSEPLPRAVPSADSQPPYQKILRRLIIAAAVAIGCLFLFIVIVSVVHYTAGYTRVTVRENGKLLSVNEYTVKQHPMSDPSNSEFFKSPLNRKHGASYMAFTDYGPDYGTIVLNDGFEITFGFINSNNWHKVQIFIDIERSPRGGKVKQTVVVPFDGIYTNETTFSFEDTACDVSSSQGV